MTAEGTVGAPSCSVTYKIRDFMCTKCYFAFMSTTRLENTSAHSLNLDKLRPSALVISNVIAMTIFDTTFAVSVI
jgi:hypothetical protein